MKVHFWIAMLAMMIGFPVLHAQEPAAETPAAEQAAEEEKAPTDREQMLEIIKLYQSGKLDEAEEAFKQAKEAHPDSPLLANLHNLAYSALMRANRSAEALAHMEAAAEQQMKEAVRTGSAETFSRIAGMLMEMSEQRLGAGEGAKVLERLSAKADDSSLAVKAAIKTLQAGTLIKEGKADELRATMAEYAQTAKQAAEAAPQDADATRTYVSVMKSRIEVEQQVDGGDADSLSTEMFGYLAEAAKTNPDQMGNAYISELMKQAMMLARTAPEQAEEHLQAIRSYQENEGASVDLPQQVERQLSQIQSTVSQAIKMNALIGQDAAYPENMQAWVNGEELTPESLKGKVVLLDFFAVWCGPCIATFPHLRDWHDQYSDQGFEIIGITSYYGYGWDANTNRPKREEGIEPSAEEEALEQFVAHHELRHPIAYSSDRNLSKHYLVSGIPHMVLIDRQGKVRMFRIGSGEENARAIEKAIKECLAESADAPAS